MSDKIIGYEWDDIKRMQQKEDVRKVVNTSTDGKQPATEVDYKLLEKHGVDGLRKLEYYGVLDRLNIPFKE